MTSAEHQLPLIAHAVRPLQQGRLSAGCLYVWGLLSHHHARRVSEVMTHTTTCVSFTSNTITVPCNQFGGQAPGTSEEERAWAHKKFGFDFPVMVRVVNRLTTCTTPAGQDRGQRSWCPSAVQVYALTAAHCPAQQHRTTARRAWSSAMGACATCQPLHHLPLAEL